MKIARSIIIATLLAVPQMALSHDEEKKTVEKHKLSLSYAASNTIEKERAAYGFEYAKKINKEPYKFLDTNYVIEATISGSELESDTTTEITTTKKIGFALKVTAENMFDSFEPYFSVGFENISEYKETSIITTESKNIGTHKYLAGVSVPINGFLSMSLSHSQNYKAMFSDKVADETKAELSINILKLFE